MLHFKCCVTRKLAFFSSPKNTVLKFTKIFTFGQLSSAVVVFRFIYRVCNARQYYIDPKICWWWAAWWAYDEWAYYGQAENSPCSSDIVSRHMPRFCCKVNIDGENQWKIDNSILMLMEFEHVVNEKWTMDIRYIAWPPAHTSPCHMIVL